ncbi:hypothetical protein EC968_005964 [Mortierella alpina]|nr:hypothetical protein EC968_005964 [Mortierella alpina]
MADASAQPPADLLDASKQGSAVHGQTSISSLAADHGRCDTRDGGSSGSPVSDMVAIEGEVSHMEVQASESVPGAPSTPALSTSPNASLSASEFPSSTSLPHILGGAINPGQEAQPSRTHPHAYTDGYPYSRSGPWSSSSPSTSSSYSTPTCLMTTSLIQSKESVYAAVPISSELYIIPKSSRGFQWNGDLFLKPHQRRNLGADHFLNSPGHLSRQTTHYSSDGYSGYNGNSGGSAAHANGQQRNQHHHNQDSSVSVHEIRLDDQEGSGILPSWP